MNDIASTAFIDPKAELGERLKVGPGAFVGAGVALRDGCEIGPNAIVQGPAVVGEGCRIFANAVVGSEAQVVDAAPERGGVEIGAGAVIREMATVHRSMRPDGNTTVGEKSYVMVGAHVAHDCRVGDEVVLTNHCSLAGHVEVGNKCFISHLVGVHQYVRIGEGSILVGPSAVRKDAPPFVRVIGEPPRVVGLNVVGLRRSGVSAEARESIRRAYKILFGAPGAMAQKIEQIEAQAQSGAEVRAVLGFARDSKRGIYQGRV